MFEIGSSELFLVAIVALLVIGPKELPNALRTIGRFTGKARAMTRHLRSGFDEMMRQAELEEMQKQWEEHNRSIMAQAPSHPDTAYPAPDPMPAAPEAPTPPEARSPAP
jgi:sec-independent protein translocase protein TatB